MSNDFVDDADFFPSRFQDCFGFDESAFLPVPRGVKKLLYFFLWQRYSISVNLRLAQYLQRKDGAFRGVCRLLGKYFERCNEVKNNSEISPAARVARGTVFHHGGVVVTAGSVIEKDVHLYRNVLLGIKDGKAPHIKSGAKLGSNSIILGGISIGRRAIVAPGAVVVEQVEDGTVVGGVPARFICFVSQDNYDF